MPDYDVRFKGKRKAVTVTAKNLHEAAIKAARQEKRKDILSVRRLSKSGKEYEAKYFA